MEFELNIVFVEQKLTTHLFGVLCRFECNMFPVVSLKMKVILTHTPDIELSCIECTRRPAVLDKFVLL